MYDKLHCRGFSLCDTDGVGLESELLEHDRFRERVQLRNPKVSVGECLD